MHFSLSYAGVREIIVYKTKNKVINLKPSLLQDEKNGIAMLQKNEEILK
jgi:hypothetical protein